MATEAQRTILKTIHSNTHARLDGRSLRPLKDAGYLKDDNKLTIVGYHEIGLWKRAPYFDLSKIKPEDFAGKSVMVSEEFYDYADEYEEYSYELDAEKIVTIYKEYLGVVNEHIKKYWSNDMDYALDRNMSVSPDEPLRQVDINIRRHYQGQANKIVNLAKQHTSEECGWKSDMRYTHHIVIEAAQRLLDGQKNICVSTSRKYSFHDTEDELKLVQHGEALEKQIGL